MKIIWKNLASRIWLIVTPIVLALLLVVNILASVTFFDAIATLWGRETTKIVGEELKLYETDEGITDKQSALANGNRVSTELCEEGFVLLKNERNALPLSSDETKISVFGKNSVNMAVGGSGSGGGVTVEVDIFKSLTDSGFTYNQALVDFYNDNSRSGAGRSGNPSDLDSGNTVTLDIGETPISSYTDELWNSCSAYNDAALIVLTRIGGEGFDMPRSSDGTHSLQLSKDESDLIAKVATMSFKKVVVVINAVTTMELKAVNDNDGVDAVLWVGYPGACGMTALGEILKGETLNGEKLSPSGRTVDTWAADFTHSPVWENFGAALGGDSYLMVVGRGVSNETVYFVDYEEGIYVGYRYYETAYAESEENGGYYDFVYADEVVYPFGYGLSYSKFDWELTNADEVNGFEWTENNSITFDIKVTNSGAYPARDVVELYATVPYLGGVDEDGNVYGIEKSAKVLVGFAKTGVIAVGGSETVHITVNSLYDLASYDYNDANANGFKGYEAEAGEYIFTVSTDAHNAKLDDKGVPITVTTTLGQGVKFEKDPVTGENVKNQYTGGDDAADKELGSVLSRADFNGTWPEHRSDSEKTVSADWIAQIKSVEDNPNSPEQNYEMPTVGKDNGIKLEQLIGVDYDDAKWSDFLDQLTVKELTALVNNGAFHTTAIERLQVPQTTSSDGPVGFTNFIGAPEIYDTCSYPCEVIVSSTWNIERVYDMGRAVGNEALIGNEKGDGTPYSGWYAPGLNLHRSPFGGRNYEYYSEDSFLSGMMTAAIVEGCGDKGVYVTMKHFALNDQETHRSRNGLLTWATEQSMREIYLKGFEIAIKTANAYAEEQGKIIPLAVMSSFNRIGERWAGGDYRLLTTILREEWGFRGLVISDFNTCTHMIVKDMVYAGGDLNLQMAGQRVYDPDKNSAADISAFRAAAKNILYVVANCNVMRGEFTIVMPLWQTLMIVFTVLIAVGLAAWGVLVILRAFKLNKATTAGASAATDAAVNAES